MHMMMQNFITRARLRYVAENDQTTGLRNRNAFEREQNDIPDRCRRTLSCVYMDINGLHELNNAKGHQAGDIMLREVADGIRSVFRPTDALARIGGDEFLVFLENVDKPDVLARKAGEVVSTLHKSYIGPGQNFPLSCSVGISVYPDDGRTVIDLFKSADAAMYASKQHGKDRYSFRE